MNRLAKTLLSIIAFSVTVILAQESLATGFSQGNEIHIQRITGNLTVFCSGGQPGQQIKHVRCDADLWTPGLTDYFVGPATDADKVTLNSTRADGSQKSKNSKYDGQAGKSKSQFNLGIRTLTQKPLLQEGLNKVHFALEKEGQAVSEGEFAATVTRVPGASCPSGSENVFGSDCNYPQNACNRYFERYNYCQ
ncbi:MAG: hypothetical protein ACXWC9_02630 [Pseudobdellovibrionaceae bacterium]